MQIALIGWQTGGKSTLFTALTGSESSLGEEAHLGTAIVPDNVLDSLHELYPPAKKINARVDYLDVAGLATSQKNSGLKRSLINHLQGANVLAIVIGTFQLGDEPAGDLAEEVLLQLSDLETELLLSDLQVAENRMERIQAAKQRSQKIDQIELQAMEKVLEGLNNETPLRLVELDPTEEKAVRGHGFLTQKPLLIIVNHGEEQNGEELTKILEEKINSEDKRLEVLNGSLEAEIAVLDDEDKELFLEEMGLSAPASDRVINAGFSLLGLIRFFTVGDDEVRAWPIRKETNAVDAAGEIHSDLSRGFIRAEVVGSTDLLRLGALSKCRDEGILRLEGKQYIVKDGDIMHIRFAV